MASGLVRVAAYARFRELDVNAEVAKFDGLSISQRICDVVENSLNHVEDLDLDQARLAANFSNDVPFR
jgi:hypothetical protein